MSSSLSKSSSSSSSSSKNNNNSNDSIKPTKNNDNNKNNKSATTTTNTNFKDNNNNNRQRSRTSNSITRPSSINSNKSSASSTTSRPTTTTPTYADSSGYPSSGDELPNNWPLPPSIHGHHQRAFKKRRRNNNNNGRDDERHYQIHHHHHHHHHVVASAGQYHNRGTISPTPLSPISNSGSSISSGGGGGSGSSNHHHVKSLSGHRSNNNNNNKPLPNPPPPAILAVAVAQFKDRGSVSKNTTIIIEQIQKASQSNAQVVVFHETATTGYFDSLILKAGRELRESERLICAACKANNIACIVGTPHFSERHGIFHNTILVVDEKGRCVCRQSKRQLVPTDDWATPGYEILVFRIAGGTPCCAIICHDVRHPELVRLPVLKGARVVFYCSWETSHDDKPIALDNVEELAVYRAQVQARAVENGVWLVHSNACANIEDRNKGSHGMSRIVNPHGKIVKEANCTEETLLIHRLDMKLAKAKYALESFRISYVLRDWYKNGATYSNELSIPPESPRLTPRSPKT